MPPFLALCGWVVGGVVENGVCPCPLSAGCLLLLPVCVHAGEFVLPSGLFFIRLCQPDISTHISINAAHSVSSHTDRASRP
eukprot:scaffold4613_cov129-Isochrysis_galbana.AAC.2